MSRPSVAPVGLDRALDFGGRVAIVTGAAKGIGRAIALRLAEAGAEVVVNYRRDADPAEAVVAEIAAAGGRARAHRADVTRADEVADLFGAAPAADLVVNNAGIYPLHGLTEMSAEDWHAVVDANLTSVHLCTAEAGRRMAAGGSVVNIASIEASAPAFAHAHYNAAKAGVLMHTRAAALELGPRGIRVNAVSPGLVWADGLDAAWPEGVERYVRAAPLGRLVAAHEIADAVLFLASDLARFVSGTNLVVDGGVLCAPSF